MKQEKVLHQLLSDNPFMINKSEKDKKAYINELAFMANRQCAEPLIKEMCPSCGEILNNKDQFCKHCGKKIKS